MAEERLQKLIAQAGLASRRHAEALITAGRVRVDGRVITELGFKADPRRAKVEVDGQRIVAERPVYLVLHKPRDVVSTMSDPEGRPTVAEHVRGVGTRVVPVGRLDFHTSGVLLMTNDGEFANALLHPKKSTKKLYVAKVNGEVNDLDLERWQQPIEIDGKRTRPAEVRRLRWENGKTWLEIGLREGRNRQIHRLGEATGFLVMRLARVSFAGITASDLRPGEWRQLTLTELKDLKRQYGVPRRVATAEVPLTPKRGPQRARPTRPEASASDRRDARGTASSERGASTQPGSRADPRGAPARARAAAPRSAAPNTTAPTRGRSRAQDVDAPDTGSARRGGVPRPTRKR